MFFQIIFFLCRIGHHSTSDDSSAYRSVDEVKQWDQKDHPITRYPGKKICTYHAKRLKATRFLNRFARYLIAKGLWSEEMEKEWKATSRKQVMQAFAKAEKTKKPHWKEMFTDVYKEIPSELK